MENCHNSRRNVLFYLFMKQRRKFRLYWDYVMEWMTDESWFDYKIYLLLHSVKASLSSIQPNLRFNMYWAQFPPGLSGRSVKLIAYLHPWRGYECVELYFHSPICLHGVMLNYAYQQLHNFEKEWRNWPQYLLKNTTVINFTHNFVNSSLNIT